MIYHPYIEGGIFMLTFLILLALIFGIIVISFFVGGTVLTVVADIIIGFIFLGMTVKMLLGW